MRHHFDRLETRSMEHREKALFHDLRSLLPHALKKAPSLARQLKGIAIEGLKDRDALSAVPVLRKSDLGALQAKRSPFGGLAVTKAGAMKRLLASPGPVYEPQGYGRDWWGAARALHAAGLRRHDILHNAFSYHLTPGGHIMESGAHALKCAVIPAGTGQTEQQLDAIGWYRPTAYCGTPDYLKILLDAAEAAGLPPLSFKRALVSGAAFPPSLQEDIKARGIDAYQAYATAELGVIAYESAARSGLIASEAMIVEIVKPGADTPLAPGEVGEVVVTRLNADYPLLRFGTGDLSMVLSGPSPCGRTNLRLAGWMGRADQATKVKGMFVRPTQIAEIAKRHPELAKLRLVVTRQGEQDKMTLRVETTPGAEVDTVAVLKTLQAMTKLKGAVEVVAPSVLPNDGKIIEDAR